jgi:hypothetical protein
VGNLDPAGLSDYNGVKSEMSNRHRETHGKQPGDPELAAQRILDIVRLENLTGNEENLPLRIPLGTDALNIMRLKCTQTLESLQSWDTFAASTDFAEASAVPSYNR